MNAYADLVFQFGMADENQATYIYSRTNTAVQYIKAEWFYDGFKVHTIHSIRTLVTEATLVLSTCTGTNY